MPSAFLSWLKSQKPKDPSGLRMAFPEVRVANVSDPVRLVWNVYVCWPFPGTANEASLSSLAGESGVAVREGGGGGVVNKPTRLAPLPQDWKAGVRPRGCPTVPPP